MPPWMPDVTRCNTIVWAAGHENRSNHNYVISLEICEHTHLSRMHANVALVQVSLTWNGFSLFCCWAYYFCWCSVLTCCGRNTRKTSMWTLLCIVWTAASFTTKSTLTTFLLPSFFLGTTYRSDTNLSLNISWKERYVHLNNILHVF